VNEAYDGKQFVGIDLHRRRSVVARMTETGDPLGWVQISNDRDQLALAMIEAGENAEVVLEATYGWYWAADLLAGLAANVHLAHPLGVKAFSYRRVKNDVRDATDLADLLRMGRLPEAWIAPPDIRDLRELVRHRAKLVHLRTSLRCQVHAVLAGQGVPVSVSDLFGVAGTKLLDEPALPKAYRYRVDSLRRLILSSMPRSTPPPGSPENGSARIPAMSRCKPFPVSGRSWGRSSSLRSVRSPGSQARPNWPAGPG
jgi:transposase